MLILTRKLNEEIKISAPAGMSRKLSGLSTEDSQDITIKILASSDNYVKIGIEAPSNVQILRGELFEKIVQSTFDASEQSKIKIKDISLLKLNKIDSPGKAAPLNADDDAGVSKEDKN